MIAFPKSYTPGSGGLACIQRLAARGITSKPEWTTVSGCVGICHKRDNLGLTAPVRLIKNVVGVGWSIKRSAQCSTSHEGLPKQ